MIAHQLNEVRRWDAAVAGLLTAVAVGLPLLDGDAAVPTDQSAWHWWLRQPLDGSPLPRLVSFWAALAVIGAVYAASVRRRLASPVTRPGYWPSACPLVASTAVAVLAYPNAAALQTIVFPLLWVAAARSRDAIVASCALGAALTLAFGSWLWLAPGFAVEAVSVVFAVVLGLWITSVSRWGQERHELLLELRAAQASLAAANREAGALAERERFSREIHDTIAQSVTGLVMVAERVAVRAPALGAPPEMVDALGTI
ncbi:MAG: histidine kinase dimerization/phosphoacceptor domain-containing protein, partial [Bifidobacteriaceae bacterium]|nr:histidine kinase dimerization/phosphoacceptor domain-containing protein [Bifidobacteriaceae bacterium]